MPTAALLSFSFIPSPLHRSLDNPVNNEEGEEEDERDKLDDAVPDKSKKIVAASPSSSTDEEDSTDEDNAVSKDHEANGSRGDATGPKRTPESQQTSTHDPTPAGTPVPALKPALTLAAAKKRRAEIQLSDATKRRK
jgi:hypothetical protein